MFFDIIVGIILIVTMVFGFRKGFVFTIVHALGWFGAMVIGFFASSPIQSLVVKYTALDEKVHSMFYDKLSLSSDTLAVATGSLPPVFRSGINAMANNAVDLVSDQLTFLATILISFVIVTLITKVIFFFLTIALSKRHNKGFINMFDGILGLVAGLIRGVIFVFLFLAVLIPLVNLVSPTSTQFLVNSLDASYFAKTLYDSNFIIVLIHDFWA